MYTNGGERLTDRPPLCLIVPAQEATIRLIPGRKYCLIGPNGCGKSSVLKRMAAGLVPGFPLHLRTRYIAQESPLIMTQTASEDDSPQDYHPCPPNGMLEISARDSSIEVLARQLDMERIELMNEAEELEDALVSMSSSSESDPESISR